MYCQLGSIIFEPLPVESLDERYSYAYAEHQVIEGKPLLQFIGDNLDETNLGIRLHFSFCDPGTAFDQLKAAADLHQALPFQLADGSLKGRRVITEINKTLITTADNGRPLCIEARLSLREWVDADPLGSARAAQQKKAPALGGSGPIGKVTPQPRQQSIMAAGQVRNAATRIDRSAASIATDSDTLKSRFPDLSATADRIKTSAGQMRSSVAPLMAQARDMAAGVQGAAGQAQGIAGQISGYSSNLTRILSGLPGPAGQLGKRMAAMNSRISTHCTTVTTLGQLTQGGAIETATRAQMITRLFPAPAGNP